MDVRAAEEGIAKMDKHAIAVYDPEDPLEAAIQAASKKYTNQWLPAYHCQATAKAIHALKMYEDWVFKEDLLALRMGYFFDPCMTAHKEYIVFPTYPIFLRDIIENESINTSCYNPIGFITRPLAHYLFTEIPIHIIIDSNILKSHNKDYVDIGGLLIFQDNVCIPKESIINILEKKHTDIALEDMLKSASTEINWGIFKIDEDERDIRAGQEVLHKPTRKAALVTTIEPGETGSVEVTFDDGSKIVVPKLDFDLQFILV